MFLAIEGLDGVGKSTIAEMFSDRFNFPLYLIQMKKDWSLKLAERNSGYHFLRYLYTIYLTGRYIENSNSKNAIVDSYILRSIAAHEAMGVSPILISASTPLIKKVHRPDLTFLLTCKHNERLKRLSLRDKGVDSFDILDMKREQLILDNYINWASKLGHELTQIDTSFSFPGEIVGLIIQSIK